MSFRIETMCTNEFCHKVATFGSKIHFGCLCPKGQVLSGVTPRKTQRPGMCSFKANLAFRFIIMSRVKFWQKQFIIVGEIKLSVLKTCTDL